MKYQEKVARALEGMEAVSVGLCPGCPECEDFDPDAGDEGHFSALPCGICGSYLAGDRFVWHWVDDRGNIIHENDCCVDCLQYLANGTVPEGV